MRSLQTDGARSSLSYECNMNIDDENNNPDPAQPTFRPKRRLKVARERAGLSIRQLGAKTGIDATTISKIENGTMQYKESHVYALAAGLNVNSLDIWEPENETVDNSFSSPLPAPVAELREDAAPFDPADAEGDAALMTLLKSLPIEQFPYRVKSLALDKIGILPGDIIVFDISTEKSANKKKWRCGHRERRQIGNNENARSAVFETVNIGNKQFSR
jgi:transcriptional regulator with XRE-family HTH domain